MDEKKFEQTDLTKLVLFALECGLLSYPNKKFHEIQELIVNIKSNKLDVRLVSRED